MSSEKRAEGHTVYSAIARNLPGTMGVGQIMWWDISMSSYVCQLSDEQRVYLENLEDQTVITLVSSRPGQQQQSSSGLQTGRWTTPPEVFQVTSGIVVKLFTSQGERFVQIQGDRVSMSNSAAIADRGQPLSMQQTTSPAATATLPLSPLPPLQPLKMGDLEMDGKAMTMKMGNMQMSMNPMRMSIEPQSHQSAASETPDTTGQRRFCSQCGTVIKPSDRFCASCGHRLD